MPTQPSRTYLSGLLQRDDREIQHVPAVGRRSTCLREAPIDLVLAGQGNNGFDRAEIVPPRSFYTSRN